MKTKVIFRKFTKFPHEIIAIFPAELGTTNPDTCLSYIHNGQHGAANTNPANTRPATPAEYNALMKELESLGYDLEIAKRANNYDFNARVSQLRSM